MTPDIMLHQKLHQASRRIRLLLVYKWSSRTLCVSALACLVWLLGAKLNWLSDPSADALALIIGIAGVAGAIYGFLPSISSSDAARLTDQRTGLKERLGSAVEFEKTPIDDPILRRQIQDAGAHAGTLDVRRVYPVKMTREAIGFAVLAAVLFGAFFLPNLPIFWSSEKKHEMEMVKRQGIQIEKVAKDTEKSADRQKLDESKKAAKDAQKLAQAMKRGQMDKKKSMIAMQKLSRKLQEQQKRMAALNTPAPKPMSKAAEEFKKALEQQQKAVQDSARAKKEEAAKGDKKTGDKQDAQKKDEQKAAEQKAAMKQQTPAMQKAQEALQKFAQALAEQNPDMQNQALQDLADQVQKGEMTQKEMQQLKDQMKQLSQALSKTDLDKVAKQMAELAKLMEQMKLDPETLKKLAQMMRQAGGT